MCYRINEESNAALTYGRIKSMFEIIPKYSYEITYIGNGSTDNSGQEVQLLKTHDHKVHLIRLARYFGKEMATTAWLHVSTGATALIIDAGLQHPPELIPQFTAAWESGFDVVTGKQKLSVSYASLTKRLLAILFYKFIYTESTVEVVAHATDFRLLNRSVFNEFNRFTERNRMTGGLIDRLGFSKTYI